jgi:protein Mpv17
MLATVSSFFHRHPMLKGMAVYAVIWPTSSVVQQIINKEQIDPKKSLRFFMFGTFFVAPTLFGWIKLTTAMWPSMSIKTGVQKAVVEQFSYGPFAGICFFTLMTLMEGRGFDAAKEEVKEKFPKTYKVGVCYWPIVQVINFSFIKERNRVPFVAMASFLWTIFLAYMKQLDSQQNQIINNTTENSPFNLIDKSKINI